MNAPGPHTELASIAKPMRLDTAFDDPDAIRALIEHKGPFPSIGSYLPPSATRSSPAGHGSTAPPWFRGNWAVNGRSSVKGADIILHNQRFIEAASRLFDTPHVKPATVVVNVNAPMAAGAVHIDIPSFRGANRDRYPLRLLQAMGTSGLFEQWRIIEAGAVAWFYGGPGGAYDYWPEGLAGPMSSELPPFDNVALVADNDRMYHRIGWIGDPEAPAPPMTAAAEIQHRDDGTWAIAEGGDVRAIYSDDQIRISVLWKARVHDEAAERDLADLLSPERVAEILSADLHARGVHRPAPAEPLSDESWIDLVHTTYYPPVFVTD